jgi:hypothetical protein
MPMGSKRAGDSLIDQAAADVVDRAHIIDAALVCYRQSIELLLKHRIEECGKGKGCTPKHTHELTRLWERCRCLVNARGRSESVGLKAVEK